MPTNPDVLCQEIKDLKEFLKEKFAENKEDHNDIIKRQDYTNGKVANLMKWKYIFWTTTSGVLIALGWVLKTFFRG